MRHSSVGWLKPSVVFAAVVSLAGLACGGSSGSSSPGNTTASNITITGQLVAGSVTTSPSAISMPTPLAESVTTTPTPLAGYVLYCVTFQSPPVAASSTADSSGNVSVTIAAQNVAFGCFVQDSSGNTVATLSFQSASTTGTTLTLSGSTSLGTIQVDTSTGLATAGVSTGTIASTPPNATCPAGYWVFQTGASDCGSTAGQATTAQVWVTPAVSGGFSVSIIHGPSGLPNNSGCGYQSFTSTGTYSGGKLTVAPFNGNPGDSCPNTVGLVITPDSSCANATVVGTFQGCGSCGDGSTENVCAGNGGSSCGSLTCTANWSGTKS